MKDHEPTVSGRYLGSRLTAAMREQGLKAIQVAKLLGWSETRVSRVLSGKRSVPLVDIAAFAAICGVTGPKRDTLLTLAESFYRPGWFREYGESLPADPIMLEDLENAAMAVTCYDVAAVPDLLRTEDYQRWLMRTNLMIRDEDIDDRVAFCLKRQHVIDVFPPEFQFFLDERVLTDPRPGRDIMSDQVHHLLRMAIPARELIRVVPAGSTLFPWCPSFRLMSYVDLNPVVYVEHLNSAAFLEQTATIQGYRRVVAELDGIALTTEQSQVWLTELATHLGTPLSEQGDSPTPSRQVETRQPEPPERTAGTPGEQVPMVDLHTVRMERTPKDSAADWRVLAGPPDEPVLVGFLTAMRTADSRVRGWMAQRSLETVPGGSWNTRQEALMFLVDDHRRR